MIQERALRDRKYAKGRVAETARMEFRERERAEAVISKARDEEKVQDKSGERYKGREEFREE